MPLPLSVSLSFPARPSRQSPAPQMHQATKQRPRGLWKARGTTHQQTQLVPQQSAPRFSAPPPPSIPSSQQYRDPDSSDSDNDDALSSNTSESSRKRRKRDSPDTPASSDDEVLYWDYARKCTANTFSERTARQEQDDDCCDTEWTTRTKVMDISSTALPGGAITDDQTCDIEDWEDLKELFAKAAEVYETDDPNETLPLLRGVIHECHRFLLFYQDPSVLFMNNRIFAKKEEPPQYFELKEWNGFPPPDKIKARSVSRPPVKPPTPPPKKCKCLDLPTAFHTILGTALFFFGTLIAQSPELALPGEPPSPIPYWLAALDVFETGETLPTRTSDAICESMPEDWRMAVIWGRTLVALAEEIIKREDEERKKGNPDLGVASGFCAEEPEWPHESPFSAIAARRPPVTRRMTMAGSSANEILVLAMDQFSRGIFHMPHAHNRRSPLPSTSYFSHLPAAPSPATTPSTPGTPDITFSRAKELYTIATEVLLISEKLTIPSERAHWANWADSVFQQMKMEVDTDEAWRNLILQSRGRAWLVVGSARAEELEDALERGEEGVLAGLEAEDAREALEMASEFFEKALDATSSSSGSYHSTARGGDRMDEDGLEEEREELKRLLAEALVTLGNLMLEDAKREELYRRAKEVGGELFELDGEDMDVE